jgi:hypothetical protein
VRGRLHHEPVHRSARLPQSPEAIEAAKLGTLAGSFLSAVAGWAVLRFTTPVQFSDEEIAEAREIFGEDQDPGRHIQPTLSEEMAAGEPGMRRTPD